MIVPRIPHWHLGNTVLDRCLLADVVTIGPQSVLLRVGDISLTIYYSGRPMHWGDKRQATDLELTTAALNAEERPGGGSTNAALTAARLVIEQTLPVHVILLDMFAPAPALEAACAASGVSFLSPRVSPCPANLVVVERGRCANRIVLKAPAELPVLTDELRAWFDQQLDKSAATTPVGCRPCLLINSPKSVELARHVSDRAAERGAHQYSVLTGSLSPPATLGLLARDVASVANLAEFAELAAELRLPCPCQEVTADLVEVADTMCRVGREVSTGHMIVTLGGRGCLVYKRGQKSGYHIRLKRPFARLTHSLIARHPERVNGVGDAFAAALMLAAEFGSDENRDIVRAASWASLEAVRRLAPSLAVRRSWFHTSPIRVVARKQIPSQTL